MAIPVAGASAHVHGITPLLVCGNTAVNGANRTDSTPAAIANGGPITGLIPRDVGNAPLTLFDGGFDAAAVPLPELSHGYAAGEAGGEDLEPR